VKKLGFEVHALIGIDTLPENFLSVVDTLKQMDEVVSLYTSSGDHMILLETWMKDSEELISFVRYLESIPGVTRVCPAILLEKIK
jgi:Lrp/AsnC family transcriptional regulator for asnA, asnC and gidA